MKKLALLAALILLNSCSSSEPTPDAPPLPLPEDTASTPASDATLISDPSLAEQPSPAPASTSAATESEAVDSLLATPVPDSGTVKVNPEPSPESLSAPTP